MLERPALRSRFNWARRVRIWLARSSASILCTSERSGAATEGFVGVLVAGGTAASLHLNAASATRNTHIRVDLNLRSSHLQVS